MTRRLFALTAACLLLCSCGGSPAISSQNTSLTEFTGWTEESLKDPEESEIPSNSETSLSTEESKEDSKEEPAWGENWFIPTPGEGVFDYSTEDQITTKGNQKSVWTSGNSTFTVEQGESTIYVGNTSPSKSFFSNPLRLYTDQVVTLSSDAPFSSVTFYVAENKRTDRYHLIDIELEDASWNVDLDAQTIELSFSSPVTEYSFILTDGQVYLHYLVLNFAE